MIEVKKVTNADIKIIQKIVNITWPITYGSTLSKEQLDYMIDLMYSDKSLEQLISKKEQVFYIVYDGTAVLGFIAVEHNYKNALVTRLHKIYILPETQGQGVGKFLISFIESSAISNGSISISLNVNRFNAALQFYQKLGFKITGEENIDIGKSYFMQDYAMEKLL